MAVVAQNAALLADHQGEFAVRLEPHEPVDDVHAGLLELACPADIRRLVESRLDLHERQHLLAGLGRLDEGLHDRAVAGRAVQGLFDGEHVGVGSSLLEERLHTRRERLVRVVKQDVLAGDRAEDVGHGIGLGRQQVHARGWHVLAVLEPGPVDLGQLEQPAEIEWSRQSVYILFRDVEFAHEQVEGELVHVVRDLEADRRSEPPAQQLALEGLDEVLRLVLLDLDVLVAGDAELVVVENFHAREEVPQVIGDEVFERDEAQQAAAVIRKLHEAGQHRRHLEASEFLFADLGVAHPDRQVERKPGDVREGVGGIDRERHQHGEDACGEDLVERLAVGRAEIRPGLDVDAGVVEVGLDEVAERRGVACLQFVGAVLNHGEHLCRRGTDVGRHSEPRKDATLEARNAHHEELVEVAGEDREEVRAFEQREFRVFGELQHPRVEREPAQFAVEIPVGRKSAVIHPTRVVVVVECVSSEPRLAKIGLAVHCIIIPPHPSRVSRGM